MDTHRHYTRPRLEPPPRKRLDVFLYLAKLRDLNSRLVSQDEAVRREAQQLLDRLFLPGQIKRAPDFAEKLMESDLGEAPGGR